MRAPVKNKHTDSRGNGNSNGLSAAVLRTIADEVRTTVRRHAPQLLSRHGDDIVADVRMAMLDHLGDIEHVRAYARRATVRRLSELAEAEGRELLSEYTGEGSVDAPDVETARAALGVGADARSKALSVASSPIADADSPETRDLKTAAWSRALLETAEFALGQLSPEEQLDCLSDELRDTSTDRDFVWALWALLDARRDGAAMSVWGERGREHFRLRPHRAPFTRAVEHLARRIYTALLRNHLLGLPTRARVAGVIRILAGHDGEAPWRGRDLVAVLTPVLARIGDPSGDVEAWARRGSRRVLKALGVSRATADGVLKNYV